MPLPSYSSFPSSFARYLVFTSFLVSLFVQRWARVALRVTSKITRTDSCLMCSRLFLDLLMNPFHPRTEFSRGRSVGGAGAYVQAVRCTRVPTGGEGGNRNPPVVHSPCRVWVRLRKSAGCFFLLHSAAQGDFSIFMGKHPVLSRSCSCFLPSLCH